MFKLFKLCLVAGGLTLITSMNGFAQNSSSKCETGWIDKTKGLSRNELNRLHQQTMDCLSLKTPDWQTRSALDYIKKKFPVVISELDIQEKGEANRIAIQANLPNPYSSEELKQVVKQFFIVRLANAPLDRNVLTDTNDSPFYQNKNRHSYKIDAQLIDPRFSAFWGTRFACLGTEEVGLKLVTDALGHGAANKQSEKEQYLERIKTSISKLPECKKTELLSFLDEISDHVGQVLLSIRADEKAVIQQAQLQKQQDKENNISQCISKFGIGRELAQKSLSFGSNAGIYELCPFSLALSNKGKVNFSKKEISANDFLKLIFKSNKGELILNIKNDTGYPNILFPASAVYEGREYQMKKETDFISLFRLIGEMAK